MVLLVAAKEDFVLGLSSLDKFINIDLCGHYIKHLYGKKKPEILYL